MPAIIPASMSHAQSAEGRGRERQQQEEGGDATIAAPTRGLMKLPSSKYYCRDCRRVMDGIEYMQHPADHWVSKVRMEMIS